MKLFTYIIAAASVIAGVSASIIPAAAPSSDGSLAFELCDANAKYAIAADSIKLSPYPIVSGKPIDILLSGTVNTVIQKGAMTRVAVKVGFFTKKIDIDICEQAGRSGLSCPIQPGKHAITLNMDVPWSPVGGIEVGMTSTVQNGDSSTLFCFKSTVRLA
ncbi:ML domain-containing protein [Syncephalis fuscata]|nr:ML domain-containing protein [Syncephalis fuscata]